MAPAQQVKQAEGLQIPMAVPTAVHSDSLMATTAWPYGRCLVGVHGRADGPLQEADFAAIHTARVEAVKLMSTARPEDVDRLLTTYPGMFIMVRLVNTLPKQLLSAEVFVGQVVQDMRHFYERGVRYFEVHNEPNLDRRGFSRTWTFAQEFATWFMQVRNQLKSFYPEAQIGLPGMLPGMGIVEQRQANLGFLTEADEAVREADWVGLHLYWRTTEEMDSEAAGASYHEYQQQYPDKLLFITEFGNLAGDDDKAAKGRQYVEYYKRLRNEPGIGAAFSFVLSSPTEFESETWRDESGAATAIPQLIGEWRAQEQTDATETPQQQAGETPDETPQATATEGLQAPATPVPAAPPPEIDARYILSFGNDRLGGDDELNYDDYAKAFASVLKNPDTKTPLTIGIYGAWGSGKSYLMQRIQLYLKTEAGATPAALVAVPPLTWGQRLKRGWSGLRPKQADKTTAKIDFHIVEFNAWVYSGSENLWAGLITHLYDEVEKYLGLRRAAAFRFNRNARAAVRKNIWQLATFGLLAVLLSLLFNLSEVLVGVTTLGTTVSGLVGLTALGAVIAAVVALFNALRGLTSSLVLQRAEQLAALASRRDFRDKIGFMADIKGEIKTIRQLLEQGRAKGAPTRLVIFIDDLDRCPPNKAVEVLEAIMLLLADEDGMPFVVVLGIDARIVVKAVEERYGKVLTEAGISGYEYLDKIVQIPFRIPAADSAALVKFVESLLWQSAGARKAAEEEKQRKLSLAAYEEKVKQDRSSAKGTGEPDVKLLVMNKDGTNLRELPAQITIDARPTVQTLASSEEIPTPPPPPPPAAVPPPAAEVAFSDDERAVFAVLAQSSHLTSNPRRVKRIVNIYRIVRMLVGKTTRAQRAQMIKWVVLSEQWPFRTAWMLQAVEDFEQNVQAKLTVDSDLSAVYACVQAEVQAKEAQSFVVLDADPELFRSFITADPAITVRHVLDLRRFSFNLNPALQGEVIKAAARKIAPVPPTPPVSPSERTSLSGK